MSTFNEANTVEAFIRDLLCGGATNNTESIPGLARRSGKLLGLGWHYISPGHLPRQPQDVIVESQLSEALIRLNPEIAEQTNRVDEVIYRLRAILLTVRNNGLIRTNEVFATWLRGEMSMPFGEKNQHVPINIIDYENIENNQFVVTQQFTFRLGADERRADLVLLVNGLPLVLIEAKTPVRQAESWVDGALQIHENYEQNVPELFVPNILSIATEGKDFRYGSIGMPIDIWGPWRIEDSNNRETGLDYVKQAVKSMLRPHVLIDILANFTIFATDKKGRRIKIVCRYQQFEAANLIVDRVVTGHPKKGLIWHFQGSGKSLLMVFAAQKLRLHPSLKSPTVVIVVDRIDLDTQISATFHGSDVPNLVKADTRQKLEQLLSQDARKIIITTIFKFAETEGVLNDRENIYVLVDEAHRTQEGDLGRKMRGSLPNAFLFGLTGTPINRRDRNTFYAFGAVEDDHGYLSRYGFEESILDNATLPLHFESRLLDLHIDHEAIDQAYDELTGGLSDLDKDQLARTASKMDMFIKVPERIERICEDIAKHFSQKVEPNGFGAQVVTFDRASCLLYKAELDKYLSAEKSEVVISVNSGEDKYKKYDRSRDEEEKLLDRFRDQSDPLKILIVTSKLLTGFDAPILQAMYLDKPLRDHTLLQAICRTNRRHGEHKRHGLIVDYLGVFDDVAKALEFDEKGLRQVVSNIEALIEKLPQAIQKCLTFFDGVDRSISGYEGLIEAQECLPNNEVRDNFAVEFSFLTRVWEAISPDPVLSKYENDYKWLTNVYQSVLPPSGNGKLIWHSLGAKTIELIHNHVHVEDIRDDFDTLILDANILEKVFSSAPNKEVKEIEIKVTKRLQNRMGDPKFKELSIRLEHLKDRHERGLLNSIEFLKELLELAKELVQAEKDTILPTSNEDKGKAALSELFQDVKNNKTPIMVERIVAEIDEIVRQVRFPGWQNTNGGKREVKRALRKALLKYLLHHEDELFYKAYGYIEIYY